MATLSGLFLFGGLFVFGLPFLSVFGWSMVWTHTLGSLLTFFALEELFTGANLVTLLLWLFDFILS